jgi:Mn-dependent DtxR family transcriptional regulator
LASKIVTHKRNKHTVTFTNGQEAAISKVAKALGVSSAEVLRRLVDEGLLQRDYDPKHDTTTACFRRV